VQQKSKIYYNKIELGVNALRELKQKDEQITLLKTNCAKLMEKI
jgi:hypothetical protein